MEKGNYPTDLDSLFRIIDEEICCSEDSKKPLIGITTYTKEGASCVANLYVNSVIQAGGSPVLIPLCDDIALLSGIVARLDGLLLTGGGDISPLFLNEEPHPKLQDVDLSRDCWEIAVLRMASLRQIPIFGICRGHQLINAVFGGKNYQDIPSQHLGEIIQHSQKQPREFVSHTVTVKSDTLLASLIGEGRIAVNSIHHQGVWEVAPGFIESAVAPDGVNEGMESKTTSIFSVQWHPEGLVCAGNKKMLNLFVHLVKEAEIYARAKNFHLRHVSLDSHCDTPMFFPEKIDIGVRDTRLKVDLPKMRDGQIDAECMVAYLPQRERDDVALEAATRKADAILNELKHQISVHRDKVGQAFSRKDLIELKHAGKKAVFLGIENGYAIGKDISNLSRFRDMGVVYMTLCHNGNNDICDSASGEPEHNGLSDFGKSVVREMNRIGMMVDLSHASEKSFYDALEVSSAPIIASHSSCRAICDHRRNLTDEQIVALARHGGVVQICLYLNFLTSKENADVKCIVEHINHVVKLVGVDYVGIGSDFDGGGGIPGCDAANELINITKELIRQGYSENDLAKIWGGNFLRVMDQVQRVC